MNNTEKRLKIGDRVVICDSINTGLIGTVGGYKGTSVAVYMKENTGHDCEGLCPTGGTYEPEYALLPFEEKHKRALDLLLLHIPEKSITQAIAEERERIVEEIESYKKHIIIKINTKTGTCPFSDDIITIPADQEATFRIARIAAIEEVKTRILSSLDKPLTDKE